MKKLTLFAAFAAMFAGCTSTGEKYAEDTFGEVADAAKGVGKAHADYHAEKAIEKLREFEPQ